MFVIDFGQGACSAALTRFLNSPISHEGAVSGWLSFSQQVADQDCAVSKKVSNAADSKEVEKLLPKTKNGYFLWCSRITTLVNPVPQADSIYPPDTVI